MIRFASFTAEDIVRGESSPIPLDSVQRWLALANDNIYWISPRTGIGPADIPAGTQYLLWQKTDGSYGVALPLICGDVKAALRGAEDTLVPSVLNLFSIWVVRLGLALLLVGELGIRGMWIAMAVELCFRGLLMLWRLCSSKYLKS